MTQIKGTEKNTQLEIESGVSAATSQIRTDVDPKAVGRRQVLEVSVISAANAGDVTLATVISQPCVIESIVIHSDTASQTDLTSVAVTGGASKVITFISAEDAIKEYLDAADKQVAWVGVVRLTASKTIIMTLVGIDSTPVDLTVTITFYAAVVGGYLKRDNVLTMDYSKDGSPWVHVAAKAGIKLDGLDWSKDGSPW